jgi:hypothetical protein
VGSTDASSGASAVRSHLSTADETEVSVPSGAWASSAAGSTSMFVRQQLNRLMPPFQLPITYLSNKFLDARWMEPTYDDHSTKKDQKWSERLGAQSI